MQSWRVTKYDPKYRDETGAFRRNEWTSVGDIGRIWLRKKLTVAEYIRVENLYVDVVQNSLGEAGIEHLAIRDIEAGANAGLSKRLLETGCARQKSFRKGKLVTAIEIEQLCRMNLRSLLWCRLELKNRFFVHFGYDYYMYLGSKLPINRSLKKAQKSGLFIESMPSPYLA